MLKNACLSGAQYALRTKCIIFALCFAMLPFWGSSEELIRTLTRRNCLPPGYCTLFLYNALSSDVITSFLPVFAVLPFSGVYIDELKSKFASYYLIRSSYHTYIISRVIICFLCGGGVILLGGLFSWGASALLFMPMEKYAQEGESSVIEMLPVLGLLFLNGGFWSVVGMSMSTLMESKYISYATPFVLYYLLVILYERYFSDLFIIYPKTWTDPSAWPFGCWGAAIFLLEMTLIFAILFAFRAGRRLQQL